MPASGKVKHGFPLFVKKVALLESSVHIYVIMLMNNGPKPYSGYKIERKASKSFIA